jgi:hypothetical protein
MARVERIKNMLQDKASQIVAPVPKKPAYAAVVKEKPQQVKSSNIPPNKENVAAVKINPLQTAAPVVISNKKDSLSELVATLLTPEMDYGLIPNCKKPSLFKSGAEKLCLHFGYRTSIEVFGKTEVFEKNFVAYIVKVTVKDQTGNIQAEGIGESNSQEPKFLKGNFYSSVNTVLKMAKKRAYVDAILTATHTSGIFTQDVEDIMSGVPADKAV